jgi:hypothetical protein
MAAPPYSPKTICLHGLQSRAKYHVAPMLPWHERCLVEVRA